MNVPDKDPTLWNAATWTLACVMAFGSGAINWWARAKQGNPRVFSVFELLGEMLTSGLVGVGAFMFLASYDSPAGVCAAAAGVAGHGAARLLYVLERAVERKIDVLAGVKDNEP